MPSESPHADDDVISRSGAGAYGDYLAEREEILKHKWVMSERLGHDLDRDPAAVPAVAATPHGAHGAAADELVEDVVTDNRAWGQLNDVVRHASVQQVHPPGFARS